MVTRAATKGERTASLFSAWQATATAGLDSRHASAEQSSESGAPVVRKRLAAAPRMAEA